MVLAFHETGTKRQPQYGCLFIHYDDLVRQANARFPFVSDIDNTYHFPWRVLL